MSREGTGRAQSLLGRLALLLALGVAACRPATAEMGTATAMPTHTAAPSSTSTATPLPAATASPAPEATTPAQEWLPAGTIAVYMAGPFESLELYAALADGTSVPLNRQVYYRSMVSGSGRWLATPDARPPARNVIVAAPGEGITHTVSLPAGYEVYDMAFDEAETRLAFLALSMPGSGLLPWALTTVDLQDGSTVRFEGEPQASGGLLPGAPVGWIGDDTLIIDTFVPFTSGPFMGVWALQVPDEVEAGASELDARQILAAQSYRSRPVLAPQAPRLLYLGRDDSYQPRGYTPVEYDLAVNRLWSLDLETQEASLLAAVRDGSALARAVAWSPDGKQVLYAQGTYVENVLGSLALKMVDLAGAIADVGSLELEDRGELTDLAWCQDEVALATVWGSNQYLYRIDLGSGGAQEIDSAGVVQLLSCVREGPR